MYSPGCFLNKQVSEGGLPNLSLSNQVLISRMGQSVVGWVNLSRATIFALIASDLIDTTNESWQVIFISSKNATVF